MIPRDYITEWRARAPWIEDFRKYMDRGGAPVTRAMFEKNLAGKLGDPRFSADLGALLTRGYKWRPAEAGRTVSERLIRLLPGEPWKGGVEA